MTGSNCSFEGSDERPAVTLYRCYAKINLSLEVLGRRDDGYHELASVAHTISLADDLTIEAADADS